MTKRFKVFGILLLILASFAAFTLALRNSSDTKGVELLVIPYLLENFTYIDVNQSTFIV